MSVAYFPSGEFVATASFDGSIRLWHAHNGLELQSIPGAHGRITSLGLSHNGDLAVSGGEDGIARVWDCSTLEKKEEFRPCPGKWVYSVHFRPNEASQVCICVCLCACVCVG